MIALQAFMAVAMAILLIAAPVSAPPAIDINHLFQHWVRSYEEEQPGRAVQVFRPALSKQFPPSRFRMAYKFAPNGKCEWYVLSPDDAHHFDACTWSVAAGDNTRLQIAEAGATSSFKIVELSGTLLRLEPLE